MVELLFRRRFAVLVAYVLLVLGILGYVFPSPSIGPALYDVAILLAIQTLFLYGVCRDRARFPHRPTWRFLAINGSLAALTASFLLLLPLLFVDFLRLGLILVWEGSTPSLETVLTTVAYLVLFFATQAALLGSAPHFRRQEEVHPRAIWGSLIAAAFLGGLLLLGLFWTFLSLSNLNGWVIAGVTSPPGKGHVPVLNTSSPPIWWLVLGAGWIFWLSVFLVIWIVDGSGVFRRMYQTLLGGTFLELLITIPVDMQVRKRTQCYCAEGTLGALIIGLTMVVWFFGPGIVMLFLTRRNQRENHRSFCKQCGGDLRGWPEARCPDCDAPC